jgi:hypothetical protein
MYVTICQCVHMFTFLCIMYKFIVVIVDFNHYSFLTYIYITYIILTKIIIICNCYGVTMTKLTTLVPLYYGNNNFTLKMAPVVAETCW